MKYAINIFIIIGLILMVFNITKLDFDQLFEGDSMIASISILTSACAILLLLILRSSKRIQKKR